MCIVVICFPVCDGVKFEINLSFIIKSFLERKEVLESAPLKVV